MGLARVRRSCWLQNWHLVFDLKSSEFRASQFWRHKARLRDIDAILVHENDEFLSRQALDPSWDQYMCA